VFQMEKKARGGCFRRISGVMKRAEEPICNIFRFSELVIIMFLSQRFLNVLSEVRNTFFVRRPGGPEKKTRLRTQLSPRAEDKVAQIKFCLPIKCCLLYRVMNFLI
jgi:hypothetical protein